MYGSFIGTSNWDLLDMLPLKDHFLGTLLMKILWFGESKTRKIWDGSTNRSFTCSIVELNRTGWNGNHSTEHPIVVTNHI